MKGKEKASDADDNEERTNTVVYIHCSVGDELSDEELAKEAKNEEVCLFGAYSVSS